MSDKIQIEARFESYSRMGSYADLLRWHMDIWGTRKDGSTKVPGNRWKRNEFYQAIWGVDYDPENAKSNVDNWRGKGSPPRVEDWIEKIEEAFFGDNPDFSIWKIDIREALARSRGRDNNKRLALVSLPQDKLEVSQSRGFSDNLLVELELRRELIESLAMQFGYDLANDSDASLVDFLKEKAREYHDLRARIDCVSDARDWTVGLLETATDVMEKGDFLQAEELLRFAEEWQHKEHTLVAVRKQATTRAARGRSAVLQGDYQTGLTHLTKAAEFFSPFSPTEEAEQRIFLALELLKTTQWVSCSRDIAWDLIRPTLDIYETGSYQWGLANLYAGYILCNKSQRYALRLKDFERASASIKYFENFIRYNAAGFSLHDVAQCNLYYGISLSIIQSWSDACQATNADSLTVGKAIDAFSKSLSIGREFDTYYDRRVKQDKIGACCRRMSNLNHDISRLTLLTFELSVLEDIYAERQLSTLVAFFSADGAEKISTACLFFDVVGEIISLLPADKQQVYIEKLDARADQEVKIFDIDLTAARAPDFFRKLSRARGEAKLAATRL